MIPYLLAVAGGYLIGKSTKAETFSKGGKISREEIDEFVDLACSYNKELIEFQCISRKDVSDAVKTYIDWVKEKREQTNLPVWGGGDTQDLLIVRDILLSRKTKTTDYLEYKNEVIEAEMLQQAKRIKTK